MIDSCPSCGHTGLSVFYEARGVPVHSVLLLPTKEEALGYPKGDIALGFCAKCGFITNTAFDASLHEYSSRYEETQGFSPTFRAFHQALAQRLIDRFDLHGKELIEIGCGKGEFLTMLCELGNNRGVGFDPAYIDERNTSTAKDRITFIKDLYAEKYSGYNGDFVACKMTLEHIHPTAEFMRTVRRSIGDRFGTVVFFQVPEVRRVLRDIAFWDIYYEHCSYFSKGSLARLFRASGFDVMDLGTDYDDQYLMIEARPSNGQFRPPLPDEHDLDALKRDVEYFVGEFPRRLAVWRDQVASAAMGGKRAVIWGAGSKGVAFLTKLSIQKEIEYAVDINPYKKGTFMAGTGQEIVLPEFLKSYRPDTVIVMNPIYRNEVQKELDTLGVKAELVTV